jgi:acyl-coenzyme A thioesterase PaaI-like protein
MTEPVPLDPLIFGPLSRCFGCSPMHPHGLHMRCERAGDVVRTRLTVGDDHEGPPGIVHGGLVMTIADELAAWAVLGLLDRFGFTASIDGRFLAPVRTHQAIEGEAKLASAPGRIVKVEAVLAQQGKSVFKGTFSFALVDRAGAERLLDGPLPKEWERFCR